MDEAVADEKGMDESEMDEGTVVTHVDSGQPMLRKLRITVTRGPDQGLSQTLAIGTLLCGTHRDVDLRLTDPRISRRHCELSIVGDGLRVVDLSSKNGVWVSGEQIDEVMLVAGSVLTIGDTELSVEIDLAPLDVGRGSTSFGSLVTKSAKMQRIFALLERVAKSDATLLLEGETGVGKDVIARTLHAQSPRSAEPFIVFDCAAVSPQLIAGELFGHKKGAFTGAERDRAGVFEAARGGTVFLDEVGELALDLQPSLLRVLESRAVKRVGENHERAIDVRVIAATNRSLRDEIKRKAFREDLFFRLAIVRLHIPPLRERPEDIPLLVRRFLTEFGRDAGEISAGEMARLTRQLWPGNVRELKNRVEQAAALSTGVFQIQNTGSFEVPTLDRAASSKEPPLAETLERAPAFSTQAEAISAGAAEVEVEVEAAHADLLQLPFKDARAKAITRFEQSYVENLLKTHADNVSAAARAAGIDRNYLYRLMKKCGIRRA